jgi:hypothetical protein
MADSIARSRRSIPWRLIGWGGAGLLLILPLVTGAPWTVSDYLVAAAVFALVGGAFELAVRRSGSTWYRAGAAAALLTAFLLLWINAAVGIVGSENNPANLLFGLVVLAGLAGSIVARFEAPGMARAMTFAAAIQALVAVPAASASHGYEIVGLTVLTALFAGGWLLSAGLFATAARTTRN